MNFWISRSSWEVSHLLSPGQHKHGQLPATVVDLTHLSIGVGLQKSCHIVESRIVHYKIHPEGVLCDWTIIGGQLRVFGI